MGQSMGGKNPEIQEEVASNHPPLYNIAIAKLSFGISNI